MSDATDTGEEVSEDEAPKKGKLGLILVVVLGLLAGGGAFAAVWLGFLDGFLPGETAEESTNPDEETASSTEIPEAEALIATPGAAFHPLDPISVSIGAGGNDRHVRVSAVLEVPPGELDNVVQISPRLQDGILSYLRAIEPEMIEDPTALILIRSQMLRRARLIAGPEVVLNLLITDFVLN